MSKVFLLESIVCESITQKKPETFLALSSCTSVKVNDDIQRRELEVQRKRIDHQRREAEKQYRDRDHQNKQELRLLYLLSTLVIISQQVYLFSNIFHRSRLRKKP